MSTRRPVRVEQRHATLGEGLRVLGRAFRREPFVLGGAVAGSALHGLMIVVSAAVIGWATDEVVVPALGSGSVSEGALAVAALAIVGTGAARGVGVLVRRYLAGMGQYRLNAHYRREVTRRYLRLPLAWHHQHSTGRLLSNANADVESAFWVIAPMPFAVGVVFMLVVGLVSMYLADPLLALVGSLVFPAVLALNVIYQRRLSPLATRAQALRAELSGVAHESFDGASVIKALGREDEETRRFAVVADQLRHANTAVGRVRGAFDPLVEALPNVGVLVVLALGGARIADGVIEPGAVVQVAYLLTVTAFPIRAIGWLLGELPRSVVGWRRVAAVLDATGAMTFGAARLDGRGDGVDLAVRDVSFGYLDGVDVLRDLGLDVPSGRTVAVVGPTGSGKSTLVSLLARLVDPRVGAILLDGRDLRELESDQVSGTVSLAFQQPFVFEDTVRDNVTAGWPASDEEVWAALRLAQADGFVERLGGLDAVVGERGATLSGGQRQRLALARALVRRPRLLVLDDATSAVDPPIEQRIMSGLRRAGLPATVVVVAHRRATIEAADEVVYLVEGRVAARGSHEELMRRSPGYRDLITAYERDAAERNPMSAERAP